MTEYQVLARKYRPQRFSEVIGQDPIVKTLKNMIRLNRVAHAFLFCGSRGTGKTTLARLFAKALNCQSLSSDLEPCNLCRSCKEISAGSSLDVLEIDGASNRGIEDVRKITDTVGYAAASGRYKIYIIDEVHMLTKEAFNALLKTLEEPPPKVKFFFATTEPHRVLATILSRCQRFYLHRISAENIAATLQRIAEDMGTTVDADAAHFIAKMADGGMRDATSLLDQILSFHEGRITTEVISTILGVVPKDIFFQIDQAGKEGKLAQAFEIVEQIYTQGKDLLFFLEGLIEHLRNILLTKVSGKETPLLQASTADRDRYDSSAALYRKEQCMDLLDYLLEAQNQIRLAPSIRITLESIVLRIMRSHQKIPVEHLVRELIQLEGKLTNPAPQKSFSASQKDPTLFEPASLPSAPKVEISTTDRSLEESSATDVVNLMKKQSRYDTVVHFAAIELGGTLQKTSMK